MIKLFTHTDFDGISCAILAKLAFEENVDITYCECDEINTSITEFINNTNGNEYDLCLITDISVDDDVAQEIDKYFSNFYLLDHHPTALNLNKYNWCNVEIDNPITNITTCGTELLYYWLIEREFLEKSAVLDKFVDVVRNYDTWRWASLGDAGIISKQINDLLYLYGRDSFINWCISEIHDEVFPRLYAKDELILNIKQKEINEYIEEKNDDMFIGSLCQRTCGFLFADKYVSELGNTICKMHPEIDFVAIIDVNSGSISYRSVKNDIDLGNNVASLFGGGGHPKAAGSSFSKDLKDKITKIIFQNE